MLEQSDDNLFRKIMHENKKREKEKKPKYILFAIIALAILPPYLFCLFLYQICTIYIKKVPYNRIDFSFLMFFYIPLSVSRDEWSLIYAWKIQPHLVWYLKFILLAVQYNYILILSFVAHTFRWNLHNLFKNNFNKVK